jgi:imidazolonepropionase-like amidohydrolase
LSATHNIERKGIAAGIPGSVVEKALRTKHVRLESLHMARQAAVRVAMGSDAGTPFNVHGENLGELARLVEAGCSPMEALVAATGIAAQVLGIEKDTGTVESGKLADLVVLDGNPLENISLLLKPEAVKLVMQGGNLVKGE